MTAWLTIVGIGLDGLASAPAAARVVIDRADMVAGSARLLDLAAIDAGRRYAWPTPFSDGVEHVLRARGRAVVVLATGDPMHFGVGATFAARLPAEEFTVLPAPSAFSHAAARMGWALQDVACISLHGRPLEVLHAAIAPGARLFILTRDGDAPAKIMSLMLQAGYGPSHVSILENLGGANEARHDLKVEEHDFTSYADLNIMAVACAIEPDVHYLPPLPGLPDGAFLHDGQITKREVRALSLSALAPAPRQRLWDVGAGCGSVAVEWLRCGANVSAVAFECDPERVGMIEQNALRLGVPQLSVVAGRAPAILDGQAAPDAVFHGGAITDDDVFEACWRALTSGGRLVANAVTLEGEAALARRHGEFGGDLVGLAVARAGAVGRFRAMQPAMTVTQWRVMKP